MAMTKVELLNAFREAATYEFRDIPRDDSQIPHKFSAEFEYKIAKLIQKEKSFFWHFINTASKRVAVIVLVFVMLFTTACSVKAIREPIVRFLTEVYETFTQYFFEGEKTNVITEKYQISAIPTGFSEESVFETDTVITVVYQNAQNNTIHFTQSITDGTTIYLDSEKGDRKTIAVSEYEVHLYSQNGVLFAMWVHNGYYFEVVCYGDFSENHMISLIQSVSAN